MTRSTTAVRHASAAARVRPPSRPVRYADTVGRVVAGGQPAVRCAGAARPTSLGRGGSVQSVQSAGASGSVRRGDVRSVGRREIGWSTAHGGAVRQPVAGAPGRSVRLTRRGQALVVLVVALVLTVAFSLGRVSSDAAHESGPPPARPVVVVQPGQTLWEIAKQAAPGADPRVTVLRIAELNNLPASLTIRPGQQLVLP